MKISSAQLNACDISSWYERFSHLTIRSMFIPIPDDFKAYLLSDNVLVSGLDLKHQAEYDVDSEDETQSEFSEIEEPHFPEFDAKVNEAIADLDGEVFPKLNWSCPQDAAWIAFGNTLKCTNASDIYLLLKSSDFVFHDLQKAYEDCTDYDPVIPVLTLREWNPHINPQLEFRCFVRDGVLVGVSQRDTRNYYPSLVQNRDDYLKMIKNFYHDEIKDRFELQDFVMDVYLTQKLAVKLLDFNPFCTKTDPSLLTWPELLELKDEVEHITCNNSESEANAAEPPFAFNRLPREAFDFSKDGGSIADIVERFHNEIIASETQ